MVIVSVFGGIVLLGAILATLKNVFKSNELSALNLR